MGSNYNDKTREIVYEWHNSIMNVHNMYTDFLQDIETTCAKYGKLRTKDGNIISSKWWKKESDNSRNNFCVAVRNENNL